MGLTRSRPTWECSSMSSELRHVFMRRVVKQRSAVSLCHFSPVGKDPVDLQPTYFRHVAAPSVNQLPRCENYSGWVFCFDGWRAKGASYSDFFFLTSWPNPLPARHRKNDAGWFGIKETMTHTAISGETAFECWLACGHPSMCSKPLRFPVHDQR